MNLAEMLAAADAATKDIEISSTNTEFKPVPPGEYNVVVVAAEGPINSKRANPMNPSEFGAYIKIQFSITDGEYANRRVFMNNNITVYPKDTSDDARKKALTAMAMGNAERKVLLAAVGKNAIQSAEELVGATCRVVLTVRKNINTGKDDNEVKKILPVSGAPASTPAPKSVSASAPAATVSAKKKMPWEK